MKDWAATDMGRKGGASRSPAKIAASRRNGRLATGGGPKLTRRLCKRCHIKQLATTNTSGICRSCARNPASSSSASPLRSASSSRKPKPRKSL